jgi:hypothetical protein
MYTETMTSQELSDKLRDWLNSTGKTRQWVADKLRVTVGSVNNWLSKNGGIPKGKAAAVEMLINSSNNFKEHATIELHFSDEVMAEMKKRFSSQEELEAAIRSFILGTLYDKASAICRAHGLVFNDSGDLDAAESVL